jgi:predicted S18 family serine protease
MRSKPYPLEAVRTLRTHALRMAELGLFNARAALTASQERLANAERELVSLLERRVQLSRPGFFRGAELTRAGAYSIRLRADYDAQRKRVADAKVEVRRCDRGLRLAELTLHQAYIEREVIERHYAEFARQERKKIERALEDEEDEWRAFQHFHSRKRRPNLESS